MVIAPTTQIKTHENTSRYGLYMQVRTQASGTKYSLVTSGSHDHHLSQPRLLDAGYKVDYKRRQMGHRIVPIRCSIDRRIRTLDESERPKKERKCDIERASRKMLSWANSSSTNSHRVRFRKRNIRRDPYLRPKPNGKDSTSLRSLPSLSSQR